MAQIPKMYIPKICLKLKAWGVWVWHTTQTCHFFTGRRAAGSNTNLDLFPSREELRTTTTHGAATHLDHQLVEVIAELRAIRPWETVTVPQRDPWQMNFGMKRAMDGHGSFILIYRGKPHEITHQWPQKLFQKSPNVFALPAGLRRTRTSTYSLPS